MGIHGVSHTEHTEPETSAAAAKRKREDEGDTTGEAKKQKTEKKAQEETYKAYARLDDGDPDELDDGDPASTSNEESTSTPNEGSTPTGRTRYPRAAKDKDSGFYREGPAGASDYHPPKQPYHLYPEQDKLDGYNRASMGDKVTKRMEQNPEEQGPNKKIEQGDKLLGSLRPDLGPLGMQKLGISRNHIIADSSVARLLHEAHGNVTLGSKGHDDVNHFISTLAGHGSDEAEEGKKAFRISLQKKANGLSGWEGDLNQAIKSTSQGRNNLRFDHAGPNQDILHGFDSELDSKNDPAARWGNMQDPETLRPRNPNHFETNDGGNRVGRSAEVPANMRLNKVWTKPEDKVKEPEVKQNDRKRKRKAKN
jgi:hypothetical protein